MKYRVEFENGTIFRDCYVAPAPLPYMVGFVELTLTNGKAVVVNLNVIRAFAAEDDANDTRADWQP